MISLSLRLRFSLRHIFAAGLLLLVSFLVTGSVSAQGSSCPTPGYTGDPSLLDFKWRALCSSCLTTQGTPVPIDPYFGITINTAAPVSGVPFTSDNISYMITPVLSGNLLNGGYLSGSVSVDNPVLCTIWTSNAYQYPDYSYNFGVPGGSLGAAYGFSDGLGAYQWFGPNLGYMVPYYSDGAIGDAGYLMLHPSTCGAALRALGSLNDFYYWDALGSVPGGSYDVNVTANWVFDSPGAPTPSGAGLGYINFSLYVVTVAGPSATLVPPTLTPSPSPSPSPSPLPSATPAPSYYVTKTLGALALNDYDMTLGYVGHWVVAHTVAPSALWWRSSGFSSATWSTVWGEATNTEPSALVAGDGWHCAGHITICNGIAAQAGRTFAQSGGIALRTYPGTYNANIWTNGNGRTVTDLEFWAYGVGPSPTAGPTASPSPSPSPTAGPTLNPTVAYCQQPHYLGTPEQYYYASPTPIATATPVMPNATATYDSMTVTPVLAATATKIAQELSATMAYYISPTPRTFPTWTPTPYTITPTPGDGAQATSQAVNATSTAAAFGTLSASATSEVYSATVIAGQATMRAVATLEAAASVPGGTTSGNFAGSTMGTGPGVSDGFVFNMGMGWYQGGCYTIIPDANLKLVQLRKVQVCVRWVQFPQMVLFGVPIPFDAILIIPLMGLVRWVYSL